MINNSIYTISYEEFKTLLVPKFLRQSKTLAWIKALLAPLVAHYNEFVAFKTEMIYISQHNAAVISIESVLNDYFDNDLRRIFINNAELSLREYFYDPGAGDPLYFYDDPNGPPQYFLDPGAYNLYGGDFTVFLPLDLQPETEPENTILVTKIRAQVDRYKFFGKKYTLVWIDL